MIRRFGAALIGLALSLPILAVPPVAAHTSASVVVTSATRWSDGDGTHVVGMVQNHTSTRRNGIEVTARFSESPGGPALALETGPVFVTNLAPHSSSPFHLIETDTDASAAPWVEVTADTGIAANTFPSGALEIGEPSAVVADAVTVDVTNESQWLANNVRVYALGTGGSRDGAAASPALDVPAGDTVQFTITFDPDSNSTGVTGLIAKTNTGIFVTSWNNYFRDLGTTNFLDEIWFMADEGITTGCASELFCPKRMVTRAEMAVFLTRALGLSDTTDVGFTDIGHLSTTFQDAINALANSGVTGGCATDPLRYCPDDVVTRGQMSKFIVTAYELPIVMTDAFTDDDGHFSENYNDTMNANGITGGCATSPARYCPNSPVLRDQMAVFIFRAEH